MTDTVCQRHVQSYAVGGAAMTTMQSRSSVSDMDKATTAQQRQKGQYKVQGQGQGQGNRTQARMEVGKAPWVKFGRGLLIVRMSDCRLFSLQGGR